MRVLAAYGNHGWEQVWTLPTDPAADPQTAHLPGGPSRAAVIVGYKGPVVSWGDWATSLLRRPPYGNWLALPDVPDGTAATALYWLRSHDGLLAEGTAAAPD